MSHKTAAPPATALAEGCLVTARVSPVSNVSNSFSTTIEGVVKITQTETVRGRLAVRVAQVKQEDGEERLTPITGTFFAENFDPVIAA